MQRINREVFRSVFMVLFLGSALVALLIGGLAIFLVDGAAMGWLIAGSLAYLAGVMAVTILRNAPMNERLDEYDPRSWAAHFYWEEYARAWTRWNHLRSGAAIATATSYLIAAALLRNGA